MRVRYLPNTKFILNMEKGYPKYKQVSFEPSPTSVTKFIGLYNVTYQDENGKIIPYSVVSRPTKINNTNLPDAVSVLPYYIDKDGEPIFIIGNQYRFPIHSRELSCFAGLLDKSDVELGQPKNTILKSVSRELSEECGEVKILKTIPMTPIMNKSAGLSNETEQTYLAEIGGIPGAQNLESSEDISCIEIKGRDLSAFLDEIENLESKQTTSSIILQSALSSVIGREKFISFVKDSINEKNKSNPLNKD